MNGPTKSRRDEFSTQSSRFSGLSPEQLVQINRLCDQYERLWRENGKTSLEDFLPQIPMHGRTEVIHELVLIDIELRHQHGLATKSELYLSVYPALDRGWLEEQLAQSIQRFQEAAVSGLAAGQRVGDYVIIEPLGTGGMGSVYRAEHILMKRPVALKIIQQENRSSILLQRRFEREVRTIAKLSHPNVVTAFDARQDSGWLYLVTELIDGIDLGKLVRKKGRLSPIKAAHYAWQAAHGLQYAHAKGIIHRDIKPENLLLDSSQKVKVLDLGLARFASSDSEQAEHGASLTESNQVLGTAAYMSPEQARASAAADVRSDIYSLGCTLFFLLTGRPPYLGESMVATLLAHVGEPIPSASNYSGDQLIPPQLDELVQRMLAKDPQARPSSMSEVVAELAIIIKQLQKISPQLVPATLVEPERGHGSSWRNLFLRRDFFSGVTIAIAAMTLVSFFVSLRFNNGIASDEPSLSTPNGLQFNGSDSFVEVDNFNESMAGYVAIEAIVRPSFSKGTSSIVSWTGPQSFVLFRSADNEWGVAYFDGITSRLILAAQPSAPGVAEMVAAVWDGKQLSLSVNGKPIAVQPLEYEMIPAPRKLFVGGIPDGIIPSRQGTRYFRGEVAVVRVSRSDTPIPLTSDPALLSVVRAETLALFDFQKPTHLETVDQTNRWPALLRGSYSPSKDFSPN